MTRKQYRSNILGQNIKALRKFHNMKQGELADQLKISHSSLSQYESGTRTPNDEIKIKIADLFNVSIDHLIGHTAKEPADFKELSANQISLLEISEALSQRDLEKVIEYAKLLSIKYKIKSLKET